MPEHQGPRRHAVCKITVHGMQDITSRLHPYLISVQVLDQVGGGADECHIELDDRNAELIIPPDNVEIKVELGWAGQGPDLLDTGRGSRGFRSSVIETTDEQKKLQAKFGGPGLREVFNGWVEEVESGFGRRGGGRRLWITGKGANTKGNVKETTTKFFGEGKQDDSSQEGGQKIPLRDVMTKVFGAAGLQVAISPEMEKIARDYWNVNESPMNFGQRMAEELGGFFKIAGRKAILVGKTEGVNAAGEAMPTVDAIWGINLIGWRIKPFSGRPQWGGAGARWFDLHEGKYKSVMNAIGGELPFGGANAISNLLHTVVDNQVGDQATKGAGANTDVNRGVGWVLINGEPNAKANAKIVIDGARPGIDGEYTITEVEHNYTRGVGYTTRCNVQHPSFTSGYNTWKKDPGHAEPTNAPPQSDDPNGPNYVPPKPGEPAAPEVPKSGPQTYTAEELQKIWQFERDKLSGEVGKILERVK